MNDIIYFTHYDTWYLFNILHQDRNQTKDAITDGPDDKQIDPPEISNLHLFPEYKTNLSLQSLYDRLMQKRVYRTYMQKGKIHFWVY